MKSRADDGQTASCRPKQWRCSACRGEGVDDGEELVEKSDSEMVW
jgi:hypothetical protein